MKTTQISRNLKIKEFKCEKCMDYIKYIDGETENVKCPCCKQEYIISNFELIRELKKGKEYKK